jgi:hypothetical protein
MLVLRYFAVVGSVLVALLFLADAALEKNSSPVIVTSQRTGLPQPQYHNAINTLTTTSAPAPDMTSQAVLDAQPKSASDEAMAKIEPAAREARAEAPPKRPKHVRVEVSAKKGHSGRDTPKQARLSVNPLQQTSTFDRFSIKGY